MFLTLGSILRLPWSDLLLFPSSRASLDFDGGTVQSFLECGLSHLRLPFPNHCSSSLCKTFTGRGGGGGGGVWCFWGSVGCLGVSWGGGGGHPSICSLFPSAKPPSPSFGINRNRWVRCSLSRVPSSHFPIFPSVTSLFPWPSQFRPAFF